MTSHGIDATVAMLFLKPATRGGSFEYLNPGADTAFKLSAYPTSAQRASSHDFRVQVVLPGVCPGVRCAVIASGPTRRTSPSLTTRTLFTRGNSFESWPKPNWGSSVVFSPRLSALAPCALA